MPKRFWHDPDDGVRPTVEHKRRANYIGFRVELVTPEIVADNGRARTARATFLRGEISPARGWQTEHRKEIGANARGLKGASGLPLYATDDNTRAGSRANVLENVATEFAPLGNGLLAHV